MFTSGALSPFAAAGSPLAFVTCSQLTFAGLIPMNVLCPNAESPNKEPPGGASYGDADPLVSEVGVPALCLSRRSGTGAVYGDAVVWREDEGVRVRPSPTIWPDWISRGPDELRVLRRVWVFALSGSAPGTTNIGLMSQEPGSAPLCARPAG